MIGQTVRRNCDCDLLRSCACMIQLACCWSSGSHGSGGSAAIMPADFQYCAVISIAAYLLNLDVEQGQDSQDSSVGVRMNTTIRSCAEAVLAYRFLHGETALQGRRANQHHGHARQTLGPFGSARTAYEAADTAGLKLGMMVEELEV